MAETEIWTSNAEDIKKMASLLRDGLTLDNKDWSQVFTDVIGPGDISESGGESLRTHILSTFKNAGVEGNIWEPLSKFTVALRESALKGESPHSFMTYYHRTSKGSEAGANWPILYWSGRLRTSMTQKGAPDSFESIGAKQASFGSSVGYGYFHQEGHGVPHRPFVVITRTLLQNIGNRFVSEINKQIEMLISQLQTMGTASGSGNAGTDS